MIPLELEAKILRLYRAEKWKVGTISRELGVHHDVVRRVLRQGGIRDGATSAESAQLWSPNDANPCRRSSFRIRQATAAPCEDRLS